MSSAGVRRIELPGLTREMENMDPFLIPQEVQGAGKQEPGPSHSKGPAFSLAWKIVITRNSFLS